MENHYKYVSMDRVELDIHKILSDRLGKDIHIRSSVDDIREYLDGFDIRVWRGCKKKSSLFMRLTIIPYFVVHILLFFIVLPIKFIVTGNWYVKSSTKFYKIMSKWKDSIHS